MAHDQSHQDLEMQEDPASKERSKLKRKDDGAKGDVEIQVTIPQQELKPSDFYSGGGQGHRSSFSQMREDDADRNEDQVIGYSMAYLEVYDHIHGVRTHV